MSCDIDKVSIKVPKCPPSLYSVEGHVLVYKYPSGHLTVKGWGKKLTLRQARIAISTIKMCSAEKHLKDGLNLVFVGKQKETTLWDINLTDISLFTDKYINSLKAA